MSYKPFLHKISIHSLFTSVGRQFIALLSFAGLFFALILFSSCNTATTGLSDSKLEWVGTWNTAPQLVEPHNMPPKPGLSHNTLRQIARVSLGGDSIRVRFNNEFSTSPVTMKAVHIALPADSSTIDPATDMALSFNGEPEVTIEPGTAIISDPIRFDLKPLSKVTITIYFGDTAPDVTGHPGSRTTSYLLPGNEVSATEFPGAVQTDHWYIINGIDILAPKSAAAVAVLGNSIADGRGSGTNKQNRWPDELANRLQENPGTRHVAVLNQGVGGNCVLRQCLGPSALDRFERDVLKQSKVRWLIIFEGLNDIGQSQGTEGATEVANNLIAAFEKMIEDAHAHDILVYGATLLPSGDSFYYSEDHERARTTVNGWIRNSGRFDAVIDLDKALRDADNPLRLLPVADTGDHLHPSEAGHRMIAEAVNLALFE